MKTMKDYQDLQLKCDVLFSVDVSWKVIKNSLKNYGVQVSFSAHLLLVRMQCLIWEKLRLNLFQIVTCIYSLKRCGISEISNRYSKANNKYLKPYNP